MTKEQIEKIAENIACRMLQRMKVYNADELANMPADDYKKWVTESPVYEIAVEEITDGTQCYTVNEGWEDSDGDVGSDSTQFYGSDALKQAIDYANEKASEFYDDEEDVADFDEENLSNDYERDGYSLTIDIVKQ